MEVLKILNTNYNRHIEKIQLPNKLDNSYI